MSDLHLESQEHEAEPKRRPRFLKRILASNVILISIAIHVLFGLGATLYIVQTIETKRKMTFAGGPPTPNASTRAIEHQINMTRKQQTMSAPAQAKRITTTGLSKISLPDMPSMPGATDMVPDKMPGMGGMGMGFAMGAGGQGAGGGGGVVGATLFGVHTVSGLKGRFYDLKQTPDGRPTGITDIKKYAVIIKKFVEGGWNNFVLNAYFKSPTPLYATQFFVPLTPSVAAPKAFGVENKVKPALWAALYDGKISPPESGTYHFVGEADNVLIVQIKGVIALNRAWNYDILSSWQPQHLWACKFLPSTTQEVPNGLSEGPGIEMDANQSYDIKVLLGDDGGVTHFTLLVEKEGVDYQKTPTGMPILPVLRFSSDPPPPGTHPPFMPDGPIWKALPAGSDSPAF